MLYACRCALLAGGLLLANACGVSTACPTDPVHMHHWLRQRVWRCMACTLVALWWHMRLEAKLRLSDSTSLLTYSNRHTVGFVLRCLHLQDTSCLLGKGGTL